MSRHPSAADQRAASEDGRGLDRFTGAKPSQWDALLNAQDTYHIMKERVAEAAQAEYKALAKALRGGRHQVFEEDATLLLGEVRSLIIRNSKAMHDETFVGAVEHIQDAMWIFFTAVQLRQEQDE